MTKNPILKSNAYIWADMYIRAQFEISGSYNPFSFYVALPNVHFLLLFLFYVLVYVHVTRLTHFDGQMYLYTYDTSGLLV